MKQTGKLTRSADPRRDPRASTRPPAGAAAGDPQLAAVPVGSAGSAPAPRAAWRLLLLYAFSAVLLSAVFAPGGLWPLVFVALVPWAAATLRAQRAWLVHWLSFLVGWGFFLWSLRWLMPVTGLGCAALAFYLALYWTLAAWAIRTARRHGIAATWSLPVVWVACEFLRARVMTGFPWLFLSHSVYAQLPLIQISDLAGAYGVSFLIGLINGVLVEAALRRWPAPGGRALPRQLWIGTGVTIAALASTLVYGWVRIGQVDFMSDPALRGPRVAVLQDDYPLASDKPVYREHSYPVLASYLRLGAAAAGENPDLVAFPETVWGADQNIGFLEAREVLSELKRPREWGLICHRALAAFAAGDYATVNALIADLEDALARLNPQMRVELGLPGVLPRLPAAGPAITTLIGAMAVEQYPDRIYPKLERFNSAVVYERTGEQRRERYDKNHLVPFGELVPFRQTALFGIDLNWLYQWLNKLSPFSYGGTIEYSLTPGRALTVFDVRAGGRTYRFGTPICYEDVMPYLIRNFVWDGAQRRVDFLISISNDGWFHYRRPPPGWLDWPLGRRFWGWLWRSNELPQHLAICALRAVENRVGIARAVNTGISGFIDPNGRIYGVVEADGQSFGPGVAGYAVQPVYLDRRASLYGRFGDWFAGLCLILTIGLWASAVFERWILALRQRLLVKFGRRTADGPAT
ncbi:MAG: nitrilase-related carbon-nitrogen hydrolase [Planctomycetota bacterium]